MVLEHDGRGYYFGSNGRWIRKRCWGDAIGGEKRSRKQIMCFIGSSCEANPCQDPVVELVQCLRGKVQSHGLARVSDTETVLLQFVTYYGTCPPERLDERQSIAGDHDTCIRQSVETYKHHSSYWWEIYIYYEGGSR